jgi:TctA family transporter
VTIGTLVGVLPGISPLTTVAMLLPFTFGLPPASAMIMLAGIFYGAQYGSSTAAILVNVPGETSSIVTCIDGYQMARQGRAGAALAIAAMASFLAGTVATLAIALMSLPLAALALKFTAVETVSLVILGLLGAVVLAHGSPTKAIAMIVVGVLVGLVGVDVNSGTPRMTFGIPDITDGISFVPIAIGLFGIAEMIRNLEQPQDRDLPGMRISNLMPTRADLAAALPADACWACCRAEVRRCRRSLPMRWRKRSPPIRRASARAPSRASPRRRPPIMPAPRQASYPC